MRQWIGLSRTDFQKGLSLKPLNIYIQGIFIRTSFCLNRSLIHNPTANILLHENRTATNNIPWQAENLGDNQFLVFRKWTIIHCLRKTKIGATGFEPATFWPPVRHAKPDCATPRPFIDETPSMTNVLCNGKISLLECFLYYTVTLILQSPLKQVVKEPQFSVTLCFCRKGTKWSNLNLCILPRRTCSAHSGGHGVTRPTWMRNFSFGGEIPYYFTETMREALLHLTAPPNKISKESLFPRPFRTLMGYFSFDRIYRMVRIK